MAYDNAPVESSEHVATITLNCPDKRNSINTQYDRRLADCTRRGRGKPTPALYPHRAGKSILPGMDLALRQAIATQSHPKIQEDSRRMAKCFAAFWSFPKPMNAAVTATLRRRLAASPHFAISPSPSRSKVRLPRGKNRFPARHVSVFLTRPIGGKKRARNLLLKRLVDGPKPRTGLGQRNRSPR